MAKQSANSAKLKREEDDLRRLLEALPLNPIPWVTVVKLLAPVIARLAVRYALKRVKRTMSEEKVNRIGSLAGEFIGGIVARRTATQSQNKGAKKS